MLNFELETGAGFGLICTPHVRERSVGYPSGQRGQTVNLLAYAFDGSNPSPTTTFARSVAESEGCRAETK